MQCSAVLCERELRYTRDRGNDSAPSERACQWARQWCAGRIPAVAHLGGAVLGTTTDYYVVASSRKRNPSRN